MSQEGVNKTRWQTEKYRKWNRERMAKHYKENREEDAEYRAKYYQDNKDKVREANRGWRERNIEKVRGYRSKYKAAKRNSFIGDVDIGQLVGEWDGKCCLCNDDVVGDYHIDHIVPVSKGGAHKQDNLQLTHPHCNLSKGDKLYATRRG